MIAVYLIVSGIVLIRLFTETLGVIPRVFNAADLILVPSFVGAALGTRLVRKGRVRFARVGRLIFVFIGTWLVSTLVNIDNIFFPASLLFLTGHLFPVLFALGILNLDAGPALGRRVVRLLTALLFVGMAVGLTQVGQLAEDPDALAFTFGTNANQTAFFLSLILSVLLGRWYYGIASNVEKVLVLVVTPFFFLAGFKSLWVLYPGIVTLAFVVAGLQGLRRLTHAVKLVVVFLLLVALTLLLVPLPELSYFEGLAYLDLASLGKVRVVHALPDVLLSRPWGVWVGVGPGSFTSRGFRTFADLPIRGSRDDVSYDIFPPTYLPPLASEYVVPLITMQGWQLGSGTVSWPFTSYVSLLAETGILGFVSIVTIYWIAVRQLLRAGRRARNAETRALSLAAAMGLLTLLAASLLDNYLEHARLGALAWLLVGVAWSTQRADEVGQRETHDIPSVGAARQLTGLPG